jgi:hypothetical protein
MRGRPTVTYQIRLPKEWIGTEEKPGPLKQLALVEDRNLSDVIRRLVAESLRERGLIARPQPVRPQ